MGICTLFDFDSSLPSSIAEEIVELSSWQETIRFGCSMKSLDDLSKLFRGKSLKSPTISFLGSGDFHHLSYLLLRDYQVSGPIHVVVFDNHPDNMLFPFGIHCGSWVYHAAKLPQVSRITVIGITSCDIHGLHLAENHLGFLRSGKVEYFCFSQVSKAATLLSLGAIKDMRSLIEKPDDLIATIRAQDPGKIYLSIDKDVLSSSELKTNWDQGVLNKSLLLRWIDELSPYVCAADITGEISQYSFQTPWKKFLAALDGQSSSAIENLSKLQAAHAHFNNELKGILLSSRR